MKKKPHQKKLFIAGSVLLFFSLLALANYIAGAILFLTFMENPGKADFFTIENALLSNPDARVMTRIQISVMFSFILCVVIPFGLTMMVMTKRKGSDLFGKARFADIDDIRQEKLDTKKGLVIGKFKKELLRLGGYEFVLLAAPTRTGKGVGFCIPNLLQFTDSAVVLDIKGENYNLTSEFRRRYMGNEIIYFNPFSETTKRWNPLSYVSPNPSFRTNDLMAIATIIYPVNEKDPFWSDAAKNLFVGLGLLVLETPELPKTIGEILRQGSGKGNSIEVYLKHVMEVRAASSSPLSSACRDSLGRFLGSGEIALKGIVATFSASLTPFANDVVDKATSGDDFDLRDVRKKKMTIYLNIPAARILQAPFIVNLFFSQLINENVKELPEENPELKYQCLLLMDEFTAMGKVGIIAKGVGYMAGYNMRLAIIIQDKTQLESTYGKEDAHNIISNMGAVIYFTPSHVNEAEEYSKMIGNNTVLSDSMQRAKGKLFGLKGDSGDSKTASYQSRAVMLPQELLHMSKDMQLVVRSGIPVIKADKIRYFEDAYFKERFNAVPMQVVSIGDEKRTVPIPAKLPEGDWDAYYESVWNSDYYLRQVSPSQASQAQQQAQAQQPSNMPTQSEVATQNFLSDDGHGQVQDSDTSNFELPALPNLFEPFYDLLTRLKAPTTEPMLSPRVATAYAETITQYWQIKQDADGIDLDVPLRILDLTAGSGQFAWQLLNAITDRLSTSTQQRPLMQYIACAANEHALDAMNAHPYFAAFKSEGIFTAISDIDLMSGKSDLQPSGNPVIVIAHGLFSDLDHRLIDMQHGELFNVHAKAVGSHAPNVKEVKLEYEWPPLMPETISSTEAAILKMYHTTASNAVVSLPSGALAFLDNFSHIVGNKFLLMCADQAVVDDRDILAGLFLPPSVINVPVKAQATNYHAIAFHLRSQGTKVWQEKMHDSNLCVCIALHDDDDDASAAMQQRLALLGQAHANEAHRFSKLAQDRVMPLPDCLSLLQRASFDPHIFSAIFSSLNAGDWKLKRTVKEHWQDTLARVWEQYLPSANDHFFHQNMIQLSFQVGHFGLARAACISNINVRGENVEILCKLADCELGVGRTNHAFDIMQRALSLAPNNSAAAKLMKKVEQRLNSEQSIDWYKADQAEIGPLRLEPLAQHHTEQFYEQYSDPHIGIMAMLPELPTLEATNAWISSIVAENANMSCAIMHESWGLIGFAIMLRADIAGYFTFWIGTDYQGLGYGAAANKVFIAMAQHNDVEEIFASSFKDNERAIRTLNSLEFTQLSIVEPSTYGGLLRFHFGTMDNAEDIEEMSNILNAALSGDAEQ